MAKIKDFEGLERDDSTGAVVSSDPSDLRAYRERKANILREKEKERAFQRLQNEVRDMKAMMAEIYEKVINNK
jgi:hypothetical protein